MEAHQKHEQRPHHAPTEGHPTEGHRHEDDNRWSDKSFVADWIERQEANAAERRPLFAKVRALIPKSPSQSFRYLDLGAGAGNLDELILDRFRAAQAMLLDGSEPMLEHASTRLARFGERVQYVRADLSQPGSVAMARGPFDAVVASRVVHHAGSADRIRELFNEIVTALVPGGVFINLDYVRLAMPAFQQLGVWAGGDPDASFQITTPHMELPASVENQLAWLREAGFAAAECVYREFQTVIVVGFRDETRLPEEARQG
jgi:tRNA (cmo5U34)-methyltransferase